MARSKPDPEIAPTDLSHIHESLRGLAVPIDSLTSDHGNARLHPEENLAAITESLKRFGQDQPLVVQKNGLVVRKGNGRLQAAKKLGWRYIAALVVDEADVEAVARSLADNRASDLARWDVHLLEKAIGSVKAGGGDPAKLGWSADDVALLLPSSLPEVELKELRVFKPPAMTWVLLGIPTVRFGEIAEDVERLARIEGILVDTTSNDGI